jgi:O-antigen/teichoic acid export membrane protein
MTTPLRTLWQSLVPRGVQRSVLATSIVNILFTAAAGIAGIIIARSLGPSVKGEYAAIVAWFGLAVVVGELGQSAAMTYFVARDPERAADYLATSRVMMFASGSAAVVVLMIAATLFASDREAVGSGSRLVFAACLVALIGISYTFALQGLSIGRWNLARISQPAAYLTLVVGLYVLGWLNLMTVLVAFAVSIVAQTVLACRLCARSKLTGGRPSLVLASSLTRYGMGQLAGTIPLVVIGRLDILALSLTVSPAVLGNYAVAVSLTSLAVPVVAGLGSVAFPRIAARGGMRTAIEGLHRQTMIVTIGIAIALTVAAAVLAPWLVPWIFGAGFHDAVFLAVLLAPRGAFQACQQVCGDLLRGHGRPFAVAKAHGTAAVLMVVLVGTLIPFLGAQGAAIAASASAGTSFLLLQRTLRRTVSSMNWKGSP